MAKKDEISELSHKIDLTFKLSKAEFANIRREIKEIKQISKDVKKNTRWRHAHVGVYSFVMFLAGSYAIIKQWIHNL